MDIMGPSVVEEVAPPRVQAMREKVDSETLVEKAVSREPDAPPEEIARSLERQLGRHVSAVWVGRIMAKLRLRDESEA